MPARKTKGAYVHMGASDKAHRAATRRLLKALGDRGAAIHLKCMKRAAEEIYVPAVRAKIEENKTVFTGALKNGIEARISPSGKKVELGAFDIPYSKGIEKGTKPRRVTAKEYQNLVRWARSKIGGGLGREGPSKVAGRMVTAIKRKGTVAHPYIMPVVEALKSRFVKQVTKCLRTKFEDINGKPWNPHGRGIPVGATGIGSFGGTGGLSGQGLADFMEMIDEFKEASE